MIKVLIILFFIPCLISAQSKKFKAFSEGFKAEENLYLIEGYQSFFESGVSKKKLDIEDVDQELLCASVFHTYNKLRVKKRRKELTFSNALYQGVNAYGNYYRSGSFVKKEANSKKATKCVRYVANKHQYNGAFQKTFIGKPEALNKKKRSSYYFDKKAEEGTGYFYGEKPDKNDSLKKIKPIVLHTYESFALEIVKKWFTGKNGKFSRDNVYTEGACYVFIDEKNVGKRYIPYARVLFVIGGRRMLLLPDDDESD